MDSASETSLNLGKESTPSLRTEEHAVVQHVLLQSAFKK